MNNFTFGNEAYQYYETIAGGSGAGPGFDGTSVIQTHMTNSRTTDPEVMETRFPVIVEQFAIRKALGRRGPMARRRRRDPPHPLPREPMAANISREPPPDRPRRPCGRRRRRRRAATGSSAPADRSNMLAATGSADLAAGDAFVIETPGGGGYGDAGRG